MSEPKPLTKGQQYWAERPEAVAEILQRKPTIAGFTQKDKIIENYAVWKDGEPFTIMDGFAETVQHNLRTILPPGCTWMRLSKPITRFDQFPPFDPDLVERGDR